VPACCRASPLVPAGYPPQYMTILEHAEYIQAFNDRNISIENFDGTGTEPQPLNPKL
jgi:hypothetical protein